MGRHNIRMSKLFMVLCVTLVVFYISFLLVSPKSESQGSVLSSDPSEPKSTPQRASPNSVEDLPPSGPATSTSTTSHGVAEIADPDLLTIRNNNGRLGNQMFLLATLVGLCDINGRKPQLMPHAVSELSRYFNLEEFPVVNASAFVECNPWRIGWYLEDRDRHIPSNSNYITGFVYPTSFTFFESSRDHVTRLFGFGRHLVAHADGVLTTIANGRSAFPVFVGVHVRRGDYLPSSNHNGHLKINKARAVDMEYFVRAARHYRDQFPDVVFVVVSDDRTWCRRHLGPLGMVVAPDSPSPGHDMALLSRCNHTLMTYGTFGFWGAYLAGGQAVYFSNFFPPHLESFREPKLYLPDWVGIDTSPPGYWNRTTI